MTAAAGVGSGSRTNLVFGAMVLGLLLAALDQTIVATALPTIVSELGGANHLSWVVTGYMLAETIATPLFGKFGDLFGRKVVFQVSVALFTAGSLFCGMATGMFGLVAARAVQGFGAGGLMVTSMALVADLIPLRERGKYQGLMGSVFGVVTVAGPLLGGLFVDQLSWRWAFHVNVPLGLLVLLVAGAVMPKVPKGSRPVVDYLGILLLAIGAGGLTLVTSWGGTTYAWDSAEILWLAVASVVAVVLFVLVELRATEPVLPMRLFRGRVFSVSSVLSFVIGFAMFGGITYLPIFLQVVQGHSATESGLRMLPMVAGLMAASILSGNTVSRTGRYRYFPILGTGITAVGLWLMSHLARETTFVTTSLYMLVLGAGIGLGMQVLVIAVQNTCAYTDLGAATSGVTFLRTLGSSFGVAVFGAIFSAQLTSNLAGAGLPPGFDPGAAANPEVVRQLPPELLAPLATAYQDSLRTVFLWAIPVALLAFAISWFLPEVKLRDSVRDKAGDLGDGFGMPEAGDSEQELERVVAATWHRRGKEFRPLLRQRLCDRMDEADAWLLAQVFRNSKQEGYATLSEIAGDLPVRIFEPSVTDLVTRGLLHREGETLRFTPAGEEAFVRLTGVWREWLVEVLASEEPERGEELAAAVDRLARRMISDHPTLRERRWERLATSR
ncbi:EmrB/QacA subfamily drug resistance transporter [Crossiella equi]|uniref:EmrB/QacA subfamily drug resistance transporter n=1 Tax=Crossiella equi TaxID=130796 RepID=A0ABS5ACC1_9PSEU|nr:MDR family MFS transporter [Crossiella equi]MBP2473952.1 EmrB/QacA subfamily drug resistance transporter [Crossiella equi]